jgi:hypothetical protein
MDIDGRKSIDRYKRPQSDWLAYYTGNLHFSVNVVYINVLLSVQCVGSNGRFELMDIDGHKSID